MTADDVVYTYNFINKNDQNRRHSKVSGWLDSIEKTGKYSVRFNLQTPYANFFNDCYRIKTVSYTHLTLPTKRIV